MLSIGTISRPVRGSVGTCASVPVCAPIGSSTWPRAGCPAASHGLWGNSIVANVEIGAEPAARTAGFGRTSGESRST
jgi:hypothetical protein